jgi:hypothetical protein
VASFALENATTWIGGHDFTTDLNELTLKAMVEELDATTFQPAGTPVWRQRKGGLRDVELELKGLYQAGAGQVDPDVFDNLGLELPATCSAAGAEGDVAFLSRLGEFDYSMLGKHGELAPFEVKAKGRNAAGLVRGLVTLEAGTVDATGVVGTGQQVGAVASGQTLYVAVHVFTAGTTVTLDIESDNAANFASAVDRGDVGPLTDVGGTIVTVAGPITDDYWRLNVSAITGSFVMAAAFGIA